MPKPLLTWYTQVSAKSLAVTFLPMHCWGKLKNSEFALAFFANVLSNQILKAAYMCIHDIHKKRPSDVKSCDLFVQEPWLSFICTWSLWKNSSCTYVLVPLCTFYDSSIIGFHYLVQTMSLRSNGEWCILNLKFK